MNNLDLETPQNTRTQNTVVRLTPEEKLLLVTEAKKAGISISAFIRLMLNNWVNNITFSKR